MKMIFFTDLIPTLFFSGLLQETNNFFFRPYKMMQKTWKMTETQAHAYSYESTQQELSNE